MEGRIGTSGAVKRRWRSSRPRSAAIPSWPGRSSPSSSTATTKPTLSYLVGSIEEQADDVVVSPGSPMGAALLVSPSARVVQAPTGAVAESRSRSRDPRSLRTRQRCSFRLESDTGLAPLAATVLAMRLRLILVLAAFWCRRVPATIPRRSSRSTRSSSRLKRSTSTSMRSKKLLPTPTPGGRTSDRILTCTDLSGMNGSSAFRTMRSPSGCGRECRN